MVAPYEVFPTRDGELMVAGGNDRLFGLLCDALELPELAADERFRTNPDRVRNRDALIPLVTARLRERNTAEWQEVLTAAGVPAAPVADVADVAGSEQTRALGIMQPLAHPPYPTSSSRRSRSRSTATARSIARLPRSSASTPPRSSRELGYPEEEIAALEGEGVIRTR